MATDLRQPTDTVRMIRPSRSPVRGPDEGGGCRATASHSRALCISGVILWLLLLAMCLHFFAAIYGQYHQLDPQHYTMYWDRRGWLWLHIAAGTVGIALGPVQFLSRWRRPWPRLHRWSGRIYLGSMLLVCVAAAGLIATSPAPFLITTAFAGTALAWLSLAFMGMRAVALGDVVHHRRWMTRAYLVTLAPVFFRLLLPAWVALGNVPAPEAIAGLLWTSWALPLVLHVLWSRWTRLHD